MRSFLSGVALFCMGALSLSGAAARVQAHPARASIDLHRYGEALLSPLNPTYGSSPVNSGRGPLWKYGHISPGALALVPGSGNTLDFLLQAKWFPPDLSISAFIQEGTCTDGPYPGTATGPHGHQIAFNLGHARSDARGDIVFTGSLSVPTVATTDWAVYVQPDDPNREPGYCGLVRQAGSAVVLSQVHGSKAQGVAILAQGEVGGTNNTAPDVTELVVFARGLGRSGVQLADLDAGTCSTVISQVQYPLNPIMTDSRGDGISGTIISAPMQIIDIPHDMQDMHVTIYDAQLQPVACGNLLNNL